MAEVLSGQLDGEPAEVVAAMEAEILHGAGGLSTRTVRARAERVLLRHDADAAERRRKARQREADVRMWPTGDGMAELAADLPLPLAAACREAVDTYAQMAKTDGDPRPIGALRAGVLADLILRPWDTARPSPRT